MEKELKDKNVYLHRDNNNTVFYVGCGGGSRHKKTQMRSDEWKAIADNGYTIEVYKENLTIEEAFEIEVDFIELIGRKDLRLGTLVNKTDGGPGGSGRIVSTETRKKMSDSRSGENHPLFGKKHSEESRKKMSDNNTGEGNPNFGKKHSAETRKKLSDAQKGKKHSEETRKKMIGGGGKKVIDTKTGIVWDSINNWCTINNKFHSSTSGQLAGTRKRQPWNTLEYYK